MPTYRNTSTKKTYVMDRYVLPNETIETTIYSNNPNLELTSHEPYVKKSVLLCEDVTLNPAEEQIIIVPHPSTSTLYLLSVISLQNSIKLYIDMNPEAVGLVIDKDSSYKESLNWEIHAYIKIVNDSDAVSKIRLVISSS